VATAEPPSEPAPEPRPERPVLDPRWGPGADGFYHSPIPPKVTPEMMPSLKSPADFRGVVVGSQTRAVPQSHAFLDIRATPMGVSAFDVADVLRDMDARYALIGGHAIGCWSARPRATADVDVIVFFSDHHRACAKIHDKFPRLKVHEHDAVVRFTVDDGHSEQPVLDLDRSYDALMLSALANTATLVHGDHSLQVTCPEAMIALKVAATRSPSRQPESRYQDVADIGAIVRRPLRVDLLESLSLLVNPRDPRLLVDVVAASRAGAEVLAICRR
jgi:hypothetical protein